MKTTFTNSEVPHIWAKQTQDRGQGSGGNLFFNGPKIYSYGHHFCIANIIKPGIVLFTNRSYSNTTAKHKGEVHMACNHMERVIVAYPDGSLADNLRAFTHEIKENLDIISNPRKKAETKERAKGELTGIVVRVNRFLEVTEQTISKKLPFDDEIRKEFMLFFEAAKDEQAAKSLQTKLARREAVRVKELARKNAEALKEQEIKLLKWRRGAGIPTHQFQAVPGVFLRSKKDRIETSKGASVALKAGHSLYEAIKAGRDVKGYDLEGYTVISMNGVLKIGCHEIEKAEIERFAKKQGWK